jgi:peptidyl-prolyl cis-trans isomerase D
MPFEVFRRHQRKLLAIFAILAMFGFVVSDSLPKLLNPSFSGRDQPVATLYGKTVYRSALNAMLEQRTLANMFVADLSPYMKRNPFGGTKDRDLVDSLILQHEADRLGIPGGSEVGQKYLKRITSDQMSRPLFEALLSRLNNRVSGEQLLADIASQVRLETVRGLLEPPLVTPYDVFRSYRDENERVAARAVEVPVDRFLAQVPEPSPDEIQAEYENYKDVLPDPASETPGFKAPRRIRVEILSIDGNALARSIKDKLTEAELRTAYENRKSEYPEPSELPTDLFGGQPELTPPILKPFNDVRSFLAVALAEDRAQAQIAETFTKIKDEVFIPFADEYLTAVDELEAEKQNPKAVKALPTAPPAKELAQREGLIHEVTRPLSLEEAERYGTISGAQIGLTQRGGGRKFAEEFFDPKKRLYEPDELTNLDGTRFLARKIEDVLAHVAPLEEVRSDVSLACKMAKARVLAEKAASDLAAQIRKRGALPKDPTFEGYRVVTLPAIARLQTAFIPARFEVGPPQETPIPEIPHAGESFRNAYFELHPGLIEVAPNQPRTVFYVMALDRREPATFAALYAPNGDEYRYKRSAYVQASKQLEEEWMGWLRQQAGLKPDWVPPDEVKGKSAADEM